MTPHTLRSNRRTSALAACIIGVAILTFSSSPLLAITYDVGTISWTGGHTLSGTIETDGTLGILSPSNIIDLNLDVTGPYPYTFDSTAGMNMSSVSATATVLSTTEYFAFELFFTGAPCDTGNSCDAWLVWEDFTPEIEYRVRDLTDIVVLAQEHFYPGGSPMVIGTAVPEPATLPLLLFGGVLLARRRRSRAPGPPA